MITEGFTFDASDIDGATTMMELDNLKMTTPSAWAYLRDALLMC